MSVTSSYIPPPEELRARIEEMRQQAIREHFVNFQAIVRRLHLRGRLIQMKALGRRRPLPARTTER